MYREYLDPAYLDDFDAWRGKYRNPFRDLGDSRQLRNWDDELRNGQQEADGIVGEVVFPNTVPPFFPSFVLFARPPEPEEYEHRLAGIRAHNRWMVDWCARYPERRAGIGQIFLNDVDEAIEDVQLDQGERPARRHPAARRPARRRLGQAALRPRATTRCGRCCEELEVPVNVHGGTGSPDYGRYPVSTLLFITEVPLLLPAPVRAAACSRGVFERFPAPQVRHDRDRLRLAAAAARAASTASSPRSATPAPSARSATAPSTCCPWSPPSTSSRTAGWASASPAPADAAAREVIGPDRFMWGSDYPHDEGTYPYTREGLRPGSATCPRGELRQILAGNAAELYGFDLDALAPLAARVGPTVDELATPARPSCPTSPTTPWSGPTARRP